MDAAKPSPSPVWWTWLALPVLLGLLLGQAWLTLALFGSDDPWGHMLDEEPVLSGYHPLHQYHAFLGAQAILDHGRSCCYDPAYQVAYAKTPVFDSGSRFGELFMLLGGGQYKPSAYKIGLAVLCGCIPLLVLMAARGAALGWWETCVAVLLAQLVAWGKPARELLDYGEIDVLMAGVLMVAVLGLLIRFERAPGFICWLALLVFTALGWFAHPLLFTLLIPLLLFYYLSAGVRHRALIWHVGLWTSQLAAIALNGLWLYDWFHFWWIRSPLPPGPETLPHRTLRTLWDAPLWGTGDDRALAVFLILSGLVGVVLFNRRKRMRATARLFGMAASGLLFLALLGVSWEPIGRIGTSELLAPALWLMTVPAARAGVRVSRWLATLPVLPPLRWGLVGASTLVLCLFAHEPLHGMLTRAVEARPLVIGLHPDQQELVACLREKTTNQARILWEDQSGPRDASRWTALLSMLTGRWFIGGLDPEGRIEYSQCGFIHSLLAGRPLAEWSDAALSDYCQRYNVGWVVAWSQPVIERFRAWKDGAEEVTTVRDGQEGYIFRVRRDEPGYVLYGQADVVQADGRRLVLANVVPRDGKIVLSFHYQSMLRPSPSRVSIEPETMVVDPIPLLRLRVDRPVSYLVLSWQGR